MNKDLQHKSSMSKNSIALVFRMLLRLVVSLYTTRVILNALGVDDYGIYNVIAGFTTMFSFVNTSMSTAISRFLSYDLGQNNSTQKLEETFKLAFSTQLILAIAALVLAEVIGIPVINFYLTIPIDKLSAANILYQCTIISLIIHIIQVPFNATIIATERMNVYAYIEIAYVVLLLLIAFALKILKGHLLIYYGIMLVGINTCIFILYYVYTRRFKICTLKALFDWSKMKPMLMFSGADLFSNASLALQTQGQNIIINKFFGIVANASVGIASQIYGALLMFSTSITTPIRPRIIKLYAAKDYTTFRNLLFDSSRIISLVNIIICIPLFFSLNWILPLWLKDVPEYSELFAQILLLNHCLFGYKPILIAGLHASGNIGKYSFNSGLFTILSIGIQFILALYGFNIGIVFAAVILSNAFNVVIILIFIEKLLGIRKKDTLLNLVVPNILVTISSISIGYLLISNTYVCINRLISILLTTTLSIVLGIILILNRSTRSLLINISKRFLIKSNHYHK